jgi:hypothetical protein
MRCESAKGRVRIRECRSSEKQPRPALVPALTPCSSVENAASSLTGSSPRPCAPHNICRQSPHGSGSSRCRAPTALAPPPVRPRAGSGKTRTRSPGKGRGPRVSQGRKVAPRQRPGPPGNAGQRLPSAQHRRRRQGQKRRQWIAPPLAAAVIRHARKGVPQGSVRRAGIHGSSRAVLAAVHLESAKSSRHSGQFVYPQQGFSQTLTRPADSKYSKWEIGPGPGRNDPGAGAQSGEGLLINRCM